MTKLQVHSCAGDSERCSQLTSAGGTDARKGVPPCRYLCGRDTHMADCVRLTTPHVWIRVIVDTRTGCLRAVKDDTILQRQDSGNQCFVTRPEGLGVLQKCERHDTCCLIHGACGNPLLHALRWASETVRFEVGSPPNVQHRVHTQRVKLNSSVGQRFDSLRAPLCMIEQHSRVPAQESTCCPNGASPNWLASAWMD